MNIIKEIEEQLIDKHNHNIFFDIYSFSNENIKGYVPLFDLKNKSLLTVGSSSDQVFNAAYVGCEDITVCDICSLTDYYYYLKLTTLLMFSRDDFLKYLCQTYLGTGHNNSGFLNKEIFDKEKDLLKKLSYEAYYVWDYLFNKYDRETIAKLFRNDINPIKDIINSNNYLSSDKDYKRLRNMIQNTQVQFINGNIVNQEFGRIFDNIWLSNVAHFLNQSDVLEMFYNSDKALSDNGEMLLSYFWHPIISDKDFLSEAFNNMDIDQIVIPGVNVHEDNSVLKYTKRIK